MHYELDLWPVAVSGDHGVFMNQGLMEQNEVINRVHLNGFWTLVPSSPATVDRFLPMHFGHNVLSHHSPKAMVPVTRD